MSESVSNFSTSRAVMDPPQWIHFAPTSVNFLSFNIKYLRKTLISAFQPYHDTLPFKIRIKGVLSPHLSNVTLCVHNVSPLLNLRSDPIELLTRILLILTLEAHSTCLLACQVQTPTLMYMCFSPLLDCEL